MKVRLSTLCYIEKDDQYLMLHRVVKKNDVNKDKWIGVGGHFEEGESPEECVLREVKEETGYTLTSYRYRGLVTFVFADIEMEYMSLFTGYSEFQTKNVGFEVVPDGARESQMYVAFRMSDTAGPVPSDNLSGRPVVMEVVLPEVAEAEASPAAEPKKDAKVIDKMQKVNYLIPAVCTIKVKEGSELLMQSGVPVYQLGVLSTMPANATLK